VVLCLHQDSTPRIVKFGDHPGCPCGGTHVEDFSDINNLKVIIVFMGVLRKWISDIYPNYLQIYPHIRQSKYRNSVSCS
jgi:hypothetical protein